MNSEIVYNWMPGSFVLTNKELLSQCSELYSNHYGKWSENGVRPGEPVKLSIDKLRQWLTDEHVTLYYAMSNNVIVGYAIAFSKKESDYGTVTWVTQLVVHKDYRKQGIAKRILFSIWGFSDHFAWGIVSANPYAIRALEKATRRRAIPLRIKKNEKKLRNIGRKYVPFIDENTVFDVSQNASLVNTQFFVDHGDTIQKIINVTNDDIPWTLGELKDGWEWFAFTFQDQEQISLTKEEIEDMILTSDSVVHNAYSQMKLDVNTQTWMKNTKDEIDYIDRIVDLSSIDLAYDLGCGAGRHSIELAMREINVISVDYVDENIEKINNIIESKNLHSIDAVKGDCRSYKNDKKAGLVLCLYDVVGSFSTNDENIKIIKTAYNLLKPNGYACFSVMNYETTIANAKYIFSFSKEPDKLLKLPGSDIMEKTGNIFNPDYYLVDRETQVVYRKEQFVSDQRLPIELIVRDRRFQMNEIKQLCKDVGFTVVESKYTNASGWDKEYTATDKKAKEILIICKKGA